MESTAARQLLDRMASWRPPGGVVSACVAIEPGDRGEGWRIELRHQLAGIDEQAAERVLAQFPEDSALPHGRVQLGFIEVDGEGRETWESFQVAGLRTAVEQADRPRLAPLVEVLERGWPVGVVTVGLDNVRTFEWAFGEIEELDGWELEITSLDWRERKAPRRDASSGTGVSASGHDQYAQRLEHNRERFLKQAGGLVAHRHAGRGWRTLVVFGEGDRPALFARGLGSMVDRVHEVAHDLVSADSQRVAARLADEVEAVEQGRDQALAATLEEAIGTSAGAALGPQEVLEATEQGRARLVLFDATRRWEPVDGVPYDERLIEAALATSAEVVPVRGEAANRVAAHDGAAAILRY